MSSSDGLDQLAMFLEQTKRQAELAIDTLNERIFELQSENRGLQEELEEAGNRVCCVFFCFIICMLLCMHVYYLHTH